jgi:hypothetical protein
MWGGFYFFDNNLIWVFKIKNSKNCLGSVILFLGDLKDCQALGLKNPKKDGCEMGVGIRVCD